MKKRQKAAPRTSKIREAARVLSPRPGDVRFRNLLRCFCVLRALCGENLENCALLEPHTLVDKPPLHGYVRGTGSGLVWSIHDSGEAKRHLAAYYSFIGDTENALKQIELMLLAKNFRINSVLALKYSPLFDNIRDHPEFEILLNQITEKFWKDKQEMENMLEEEGLIQHQY